MTRDDSKSPFPLLPALALAGIVLLTMVRPGDAPFIWDEPQLLLAAFSCNTHHVLAVAGLLGTRGITYGPFAVWIYQLLLLITHNPVHLMCIRAGLMMGVTAAALLWLTRSLRLSPWLAVVTLLSPWLWFYSRQLWDNSFCIPLSALVLAGYADFLATQRPRSLRITIACIPAMLLLHFMSLALIAPLVLHILIFQRRALRRFKWSLLAILIVAVALSAPYLQFLSANFHSEIPAGGVDWAAWFFPELGANHFSALSINFDLGSYHFSVPSINFIMGGAWPNDAAVLWSPLLKLAISITALAYPAVWIGTVLAIRNGLKIATDRATPADHISALAVGIWICQSILDGMGRVDLNPHYFNATWIAYAFFAWLTVDFLLRRWRKRAVSYGLVIAYAASLFLVTFAMATTIVRDAGTPTLAYGLTLNDQIGVINQIRAAGVDPLDHDHADYTQFQQWTLFPPDPIPVIALSKLLPAPHAHVDPPPSVMVIPRGQSPTDTRVVVITSPH